MKGYRHKSMVILTENIYTPNGLMYAGAVKIIRKAGIRYVIKRDKQVAYAYASQLIFKRK